MGRRPASDVAVVIRVDGVSFRVAASTLKYLPDAALFLRHLLGRGVSAAVAGEYARVVAKLVREGLSTDPTRVTRLNERTAIKAYWSWVDTAYDARVQPVLHAITDDHVRKGIKWLRVHSLVGPAAGKKIPRIVRMAQLHLDGGTRTAVMTPAEVAWVETAATTLHVPTTPVPAHQDPCANCVAFELDAMQVETIARAFEKAWGHRDIERVPADAYLFGTPPLEDAPPERGSEPTGRIVALLDSSPLADAITQLRGNVARTTEAFRARLDEGADAVLVSRGADAARFERAVQALREIYGSAKGQT